MDPRCLSPLEGKGKSDKIRWPGYERDKLNQGASSSIQ